MWLRGSLRGLEQEDPPVGRPQVEDVGPLAVVGRSHGQRVVDGHGVLYVILRHLSLCAVLVLQDGGSQSRVCVCSLNPALSNDSYVEVCLHLFSKLQLAGSRNIIIIIVSCSNKIDIFSELRPRRLYAALILK